MVKRAALGATAGAVIPTLAFAGELSPAEEGKSWRDAPDPIDGGQIVETFETDLLVVGCGNAGIMAAYGAAEKGARVTVLEQTAMAGVGRGFVAAIDTAASRELGIEVDKLEAINMLQRYANNDCDVELLRLWADRSGETVDWMSDKLEAASGYKQSFMYDIGEYVHGGAEDLYATVPVQHYFSNGTDFIRAWVAVLADCAADEGIDIQYETTFEQLVRQDSRVVGAIARNAAGEYVKFLAAKGVILCTGGYGRNDEMMLDRQPEVMEVCGNNQCGNADGSGIRAALWVGADMDPNPTSMYFDRAGMVPSTEYANYMQKPVEDFAYLLIGSQPFLHVNIDGVRFSNESMPYDYKVNAARRQPNKCWIAVWDANWQSDAERFGTIGCSRIAVPADGGTGYTSFEALETMMHPQLFDAGRLHTADTLEELAEKLCIRDIDMFMATVARYNELADKGIDEDFGKPAYRLSHIVEPPFYGAMVMGNLLCTLDGLRINTDMQVLDGEGRPIAGLYAAGNDSGGVFSGNYPELVVGIAMGRTVTFGRLAGQIAAGVE